ncbi:MAG: beta-aspartyl-peptidase [Candidatus Delongbacteria bacterium]|nr:MAG: beta-aspartyl-peptidase [Candidatus Delongbacteria bacterium]
MDKLVLLIHGGAGNIKKSDSEEKFKRHLKGLKASLEAGRKILEEGGTALDAVIASVKVMEDDPSFNAGKGSVFTHNEKNEMDAAVMDGKTLNNGAVSGVSNVKNPILLAKKVLEYKDHSFLANEGALEFAKENGLDIVDNEYFKTEVRYNQLLKARGEKKIALDHDIDEEKYGTVGAVALDSHGNLAAATSTGGITNKRYGRVGDTPIIGSGTYADNETCAVSCTGIGEQFIKFNVAYDIAARIKYKGESVEKASLENIENRLNKDDGGLIVVDKYGNYSLPFNSNGMYRGIYCSDGVFDVKVW